MGVRDVCDAFNEMSPPDRKCFAVYMDYVENGTKEKFTFHMVDGSKIELIMETVRTPQQIAKLALEPTVVG